MRTIQKTIIALLFCMTGNIASAHPPKNINVVYDPENEEITIFIEHYSSDPQNHYVEVISVSDKKGVLNSQNFTTQTSNDGQICKIILKDKKPGDPIRIQCRCNKFGKKAKTIKL